MYLSLEKRKRLSQVKEMVGRQGHYELAHGTAKENHAYCTKEATRAPGTEPQQFGEFHEPDQGKRNDLNALVAAVRRGDSFNDIIDDPVTLPAVARHMRFYETLRRENTPAPSRDNIK